ncbi:uncharacterized protein NEMAJ01_1526 [Nematocida major]|uniref:uncharacterized protein n=1 Tax=Nematocida major TaxID=1912982 RepID=UPI0020079530|nr:uncharacterized protein NEMAJ01_1526 [Nematocida major]KAH9386630.1 hypothetical protein NEMAJ01_1526 [Nematocida major]
MEDLIKCTIDIDSYNAALSQNPLDTSYVYAPLEVTIMLFHMLSKCLRVQVSKSIPDFAKEKIEKIASCLTYFSLRRENFEKSECMWPILFDGSDVQSSKKLIEEFLQDEEACIIDMDNYAQIESNQLQREKITNLLELQHFCLIMNEFIEAIEKNDECDPKESVFMPIVRAFVRGNSMASYETLNDQKTQEFRNRIISRERRYMLGYLKESTSKKEKSTPEQAQKEKFSISVDVLLESVNRLLDIAAKDMLEMPKEKCEAFLESMLRVLECRMHADAAHFIVPVPGTKIFPSQLSLYFMYIRFFRHKPIDIAIQNNYLSNPESYQNIECMAKALFEHLPEISMNLRVALKSQADAPYIAYYLVNVAGLAYMASSLDIHESMELLQVASHYWTNGEIRAYSKVPFFMEVVTLLKNCCFANTLQKKLKVHKKLKKHFTVGKNPAPARKTPKTACSVQEKRLNQRANIKKDIERIKAKNMEAEEIHTLQKNVQSIVDICVYMFQVFPGLKQPGKSSLDIPSMKGTDAYCMHMSVAQKLTELHELGVIFVENPSFDARKCMEIGEGLSFATNMPFGFQMRISVKDQNVQLIRGGEVLCSIVMRIDTPHFLLQNPAPCT